MIQKIEKKEEEEINKFFESLILSLVKFNYFEPIRRPLIALITPD